MGFGLVWCICWTGRWVGRWVDREELNIPRDLFSRCVRLKVFAIWTHVCVGGGRREGGEETC